MAQLDVSSLKPITPGAPADTGSAALDFSSLKPVNSNAPPLSTQTAAPEPTSSLQDVAGQFGEGLVTGLPNMVSGMADAQERGRKMGVLMPGADFIAGMVQPLIPGQKPIETESGKALLDGLSKMHLNPNDYFAPPRNAAERVARAGGEGAIQMVIPGVGEASIPRALADTLIGAVSAGGGKAAEEIAPDWLKPYASVITSILLGGAGSVGMEAAKAGTSAAVENAIKPAVAGTGVKWLGSDAAKESMAGKTLTDAAEDPQAAMRAAANADEIVPGSKPTLFQATGDRGLGTLSGVIERENPAPFIERYGEQNAARVQALTDVQADGHPEAVADYLRAQLSDLDQRTQAAEDQAAEAVRAAQERTGGTEAPSVYGERIRQSLVDAKAAAAKDEDTLWSLVDPNKDASVLASPIKRANAKIYENMTPEEKIGLTSNEKALSDIIKSYGSTLPLERLIRLRSQVSADMRGAQSPLAPNSQAYGRLTQLRGAIEDAISDSIAGKAMNEQQAVKSGAMSADETLAANFKRQAETWLADRKAQTAGGDRGGSPVASGAEGPLAAPSVSGTVRETGTGLAGDAGAESVPDQPTLDPAAAERLRTATAATKASKSTFGAKPVAQMLKSPGPTYPFDMQAGQVAETAFQPGAKGGDAVRAVLNASPDAATSLADAAAASLRAKGDLTAAKLDAWRAQHQPALDEIERAAPGTIAKFEDVGRAAEHLENVASVRRETIADYQRGKIGQILGVTDPADVTKTIGGILGAKDSVKQIERLASEARGDPGAWEGLRKALVDTIMAKAQSTVEAGTSGVEKLKPDTFIRYLNQNATAHSKVFTPDEIASMRAVAQDLKRANRSVQTTPGSATAQWKAAGEKFGSHEPHDFFGMLWQALRAPAAIGAAAFAGTANPLIAAGASLASLAIGHLRRAGINSAQDLVRQAMLDPELAHVLMMKAPKRPEAGAMQSLARRLIKLSAVTGLAQAGQGD